MTLVNDITFVTRLVTSVTTLLIPLLSVYLTEVSNAVSVTVGQMPHHAHP